jgi:hypothetical protein
LKRKPHSVFVQMRDTYLDHYDYEAEAIERAKNGEDEDDPTQKALNDAPWDAETVIVPIK